MAHYEDVQPRRQGLEQLLHWWTLRAAHSQDWRQVLDGDCHQQRPEHLWSKVTRFLPPAVELRWLDEPWELQTTLWTPSLGQPPSRRMTVGGSTSVEGRPERTREGALIGTQTVRAEITGKLHLSTPVGTLPLPTRFNYRSDDPYAVETVFAHGGMSVSWTFARDLLTDGMQAQAGDGEVRVWPRTSTSDGAQIFIELSPPTGTALVSLPRSSVEEFLNQTISIVPTGAEHAYLSPTLYELERKLNQLTTHPGNGE
ncbi:SsgA family sporulation/cell division regulator [Streptomyces californicus]